MPVFLARRKPKTTVFMMFFATGSKHHDFTASFLPVPWAHSFVLLGWFVADFPVTVWREEAMYVVFTITVMHSWIELDVLGIRLDALVDRIVWRPIKVMLCIQQIMSPTLADAKEHGMNNFKVKPTRKESNVQEWWCSSLCLDPRKPPQGRPKSCLSCSCFTLRWMPNFIVTQRRGGLHFSTATGVVGQDFYL